MKIVKHILFILIIFQSSVALAAPVSTEPPAPVPEIPEQPQAEISNDNIQCEKTSIVRERINIPCPDHVAAFTAKLVKKTKSAKPSSAFLNCKDAKSEQKNNACHCLENDVLVFKVKKSLTGPANNSASSKLIRLESCAKNIPDGFEVNKTYFILANGFKNGAGYVVEDFKNNIFPFEEVLNFLTDQK